MTNSISEVEFYDAMLVIGSNPPEAHPIIGGKMKRAARRGARLVVADPRRTELVDYAALWLPLIPGTDAALVNGLINIIVNNSSRVLEDLGIGVDRTLEMMQLKYAVIVVAILPVLAIYPFVQKYFVKGVLIGAVKE